MGEPSEDYWLEKWCEYEYIESYDGTCILERRRWFRVENHSGETILELELPPVRDEIQKIS